jgi:hypothetical protein
VLDHAGQVKHATFFHWIPTTLELIRAGFWRQCTELVNGNFHFLADRESVTD